jgi:hypothetical protein
MFIVWCTPSLAISRAVGWNSRLHTCISYMTTARAGDAGPPLIWFLYDKPRKPTEHEQVADAVIGDDRAWKHAFVTMIGSRCERGGDYPVPNLNRDAAPVGKTGAAGTIRTDVSSVFFSERGRRKVP